MKKIIMMVILSCFVVFSFGTTFYDYYQEFSDLTKEEAELYLGDLKFALENLEEFQGKSVPPLPTYTYWASYDIFGKQGITYDGLVKLAKTNKNLLVTRNYNLDKTWQEDILWYIAMLKYIIDPSLELDLSTTFPDYVGLYFYDVRNPNQLVPNSIFSTITDTTVLNDILNETLQLMKYGSDSLNLAKSSYLNVTTMTLYWKSFGLITSLNVYFDDAQKYLGFYINAIEKVPSF